MTGGSRSGSDFCGTSCMAYKVTHLLRPRSLRHPCRCSHSCCANSPCLSGRCQQRNPRQVCASGSPVVVMLRTSLREVEQRQRCYISGFGFIAVKRGRGKANELTAYLVSA